MAGSFVYLEEMEHSIDHTLLFLTLIGYITAF